MNYEALTFEFGCKVVVDQIKSNVEDYSEYGAILAHYRELLSLKPNFDGSKVI